MNIRIIPNLVKGIHFEGLRALEKCARMPVSSPGSASQTFKAYHCAMGISGYVNENTVF